MADTSKIIAQLTERGETIAVAESLTGGLLVAELIRPAGASAVVLGGIVAYNTHLKSSLLGIDSVFLAEHGPVNAEVARVMARNVRERLSVGGSAATVGISTTGVAGPDPQAGHPPGVVFLGLAYGHETHVSRLQIEGSRDEVRSRAAESALDWLSEALERGLFDSWE